MDIAIKCTYNDGNEGVYVGYRGCCSPNTIEWNQKRIWCSHDDCECKQYLDGLIDYDEIDSPCYESALFESWKFSAGYYHNGPHMDVPMVIKDLHEGDVAIFTTRFPGDREIDRKIIGLYIIENIEDGENGMWFRGSGEYGLRLPLSVANKTFFWDYYINKGAKDKASWGSGLHRYLSIEQTAQILKAIIQNPDNKKTAKQAEKILSEIGINPSGIPNPSGLRINS